MKEFEVRWDFWKWWMKIRWAYIGMGPRLLRVSEKEGTRNIRPNFIYLQLDGRRPGVVWEIRVDPAIPNNPTWQSFTPQEAKTLGKAMMAYGEIAEQAIKNWPHCEKHEFSIYDCIDYKQSTDILAYDKFNGPRSS